VCVLSSLCATLVVEQYINSERDNPLPRADG
jgi:hypothetical protein